MAPDQAFDKSSDYWDEWIRQAISCYGGLFGIAVAAIPFDPGRNERILDLDAGSGLYSQHLFRKYPAASFMLCDLASKMLDVAPKTVLVGR